MMTGRRITLLSMIGVAVLLLANAVLIGQLRETKQRLSRQQSQMQSVSADVALINQLRRTDAEVAASEPPQDDLIARLNRALESAALPSQALGSLQLVEDRAFSETGTAASPYRQRRFRADLRSLAPAEFGRFLSIWTEDQPQWNVTRIHFEPASQRQAAGDAPLYHVRLDLTAMYLASTQQGAP